MRNMKRMKCVQTIIKCIVVAFVALSVICYNKISVEAKTKSPKLQYIDVYLDINTKYKKNLGAYVSVYNPSGIPRWSIANKKIAYIDGTAAGTQILIFPKSKGTTTLTCKMGRKKLQCRIHVVDASKNKKVSYSIKQKKDGWIKTTIKNSGNYGVAVRPGIRRYNDSYNLLSDRYSEYVIVPAHSKVTTYYGNGYETAHIDKSKKQTYCNASNVTKPKKVSAKINGMAYFKKDNYPLKESYRVFSLSEIKKDKNLPGNLVDGYKGPYYGVEINNKNNTPKNFYVILMSYDIKNRLIGVSDCQETGFVPAKTKEKAILFSGLWEYQLKDVNKVKVVITGMY